MGVIEHGLTSQSHLGTTWAWEHVKDGVRAFALSPRGELLAIATDALEIVDLRTLAVVCARIPGEVSALLWREGLYVARGRQLSKRGDDDLAEVWTTSISCSTRKLSSRGDVAVACGRSEVHALRGGVLIGSLREEPQKRALDAEVLGDRVAVLLATWQLRLCTTTLSTLSQIDLSFHAHGFRVATPGQPVLATIRGDLCVAGGRFLQFFDADLKEKAVLGERETRIEREMRDDSSLGWTAACEGGDAFFAVMGSWAYSPSDRVVYGRNRKAVDIDIYRFGDGDPAKLRPLDSRGFPSCPRIAALGWRRGLPVRGREGAEQLVALDANGLVRSSTVSFKTKWPGAFFPVGYEKIDDNTEYDEPENEMDVVDDKEEVTAQSKDLASCDGYHNATFDGDIIILDDDDPRSAAADPWLATDVVKPEKQPPDRDDHLVAAEVAASRKLVARLKTLLLPGQNKKPPA